MGLWSFTWQQFAGRLHLDLPCTAKSVRSLEDCFGEFAAVCLSRFASEAEDSEENRITCTGGTVRSIVERLHGSNCNLQSAAEHGRNVAGVS